MRWRGSGTAYRRCVLYTLRSVRERYASGWFSSSIRRQDAHHHPLHRGVSAWLCVRRSGCRQRWRCLPDVPRDSASCERWRPPCWSSPGKFAAAAASAGPSRTRRRRSWPAADGSRCPTTPSSGTPRPRHRGTARWRPSKGQSWTRSWPSAECSWWRSPPPQADPRPFWPRRSRDWWVPTAWQEAETWRRRRPVWVWDEFLRFLLTPWQPDCVKHDPTSTHGTSGPSGTTVSENRHVYFCRIYAV